MQKNYGSILVLVFLFFTWGVSAQQKVSFADVDLKVEASFRGVSVVDDKVAWISGSKGWVARTTDGGVTWQTTQVKGFEKVDFRSLYAFDASRAVIANAGSPANILYTKDGGQSWEVVYTNTDTQAFIDGVDFWNAQEGMMYGDPINGNMLLIKTTDGGLTWQLAPEASRPLLAEGEASFAASGTGIRCLAGKKVIIATGGKRSRLFASDDGAKSWTTLSPPVLQGEATTGIFSFAANNKDQYLIVGGNYAADTVAIDHVFYSHDKGKSWKKPSSATRGYRECVAFITDDIAIAAGPSGFDITYTAGLQWQPLSDKKSFHVIRKSRKGNLIIAAGDKKLAVVTLQ